MSNTSTIKESVQEPSLPEALKNLAGNGGHITYQVINNYDAGIAPEKILSAIAGVRLSDQQRQQLILEIFS